LIVQRGSRLARDPFDLEEEPVSEASGRTVLDGYRSDDAIPPTLKPHSDGLENTHVAVFEDLDIRVEAVDREASSLSGRWPRQDTQNGSGEQPATP